MLGVILDTLSEVDEWLDDAVAQEYKDQPMATDWARVAKIGEELGEAVAELIALTGQNPRKPRTKGNALLLDELADVVITTLVAMLHFTKDSKRTGKVLVDKTHFVAGRMAEAKYRALANPVKTPDA